MSSLRIIYSGRSDTTPEHARARAWAYVFQCWQEKQMAAKPSPTFNDCDKVKKTKEATVT